MTIILDIVPERSAARRQARGGDQSRLRGADPELRTHSERVPAAGRYRTAALQVYRRRSILDALAFAVQGEVMATGLLPVGNPNRVCHSPEKCSCYVPGFGYVHAERAPMEIDNLKRIGNLSGFDSRESANENPKGP